MKHFEGGWGNAWDGVWERGNAKRQNLCYLWLFNIHIKFNTLIDFSLREKSLHSAEFNSVGVTAHPKTTKKTKTKIKTERRKARQ